MDAPLTITGNVSRDVGLHYSNSGTAIVTIPVAVNYRYQQRGEWKDEDASFVDVVCFGKLAENIGESVEKGTRITAKGRLRVRSYENKEGETRRVTELMADDVAVSLRFATAVVTKNPREAGAGQNHSYGPDEEPYR